MQRERSAVVSERECPHHTHEPPQGTQERHMKSRERGNQHLQTLTSAVQLIQPRIHERVED
jgi:hypothetical protein